MILSGLLFPFDKLHPVISSETKVPILADLMISRWAYEAIAVDQFKENDYQQSFYELEKAELDADYKAAFVVKRLMEKQEEININLNSDNDSLKNLTIPDFKLITHTLSNEPFRKGIENLDLANALSIEGYTPEVHNTLLLYFNEMEDYYNNAYILALRKKEKMIGFLEDNAAGTYSLNGEKDKYFNQSLSDLVRNINTEDRMVESDNKLIRKIDPIYNTNYETGGAMDYRAPFYAPKKRIFNTEHDTFLFNIAVIWLMSMIFYIALYFEALSKLLNSFGKIKITKK